MNRIFIEELRAEARVGVYPREQCAPQAIEIHLEFAVPETSAHGDEIGKTIDYAEVIARIRHELGERRFNLLETLGEFVASLLLEEFGAPWVKLSIAKLGVLRGVKRVGVAIERGVRSG